MATRGAKPKPSHLRVIDGTHRNTRHGDLEKAKDAAIAAVDNRPVKPKGMKGEASVAWKKYIEPAAWLDRHREPAAIAFCELWQEFSELPTRFPASKHGQMRAYMAELGLTDERNRVDNEPDKDEFFD